MKPPIPSPSARDCPHCGAQIEEKRLQFCPNCGAPLKASAQFSIWSIIGVTLLGIICVPMGACSIYAIGGSLISPDSAGYSGVIIFVSAICLAIAALGIWGMIKMLRKK